MSSRYRGTRITPCEPMPRRSAHTRTLATSAACSPLMPAAAKMSATQRSSLIGLMAGSSCLSLLREVLLQPVVQQVEHALVALAPEEVIDAGDQVQLGRLAGVAEQLDRLLGRRDGVLRRVDEEQRS